MKNKILITTATALLAVVFVFTLVNQISLRSRITAQDEMLNHFINQTRDDLGFINESQDLVKQNAQQLRQYLSLPALKFPDRVGDDSTDSDSPETNSFELAAYDAALFLNKYNNEYSQIQRFNSFLQSDKLKEFVNEHSLTLKKKSDFNWILSGDKETEYFIIQYDISDNTVELFPGLSDESRHFQQIDTGCIQFLSDEYSRQKLAYKAIEGLNTQLGSLYANRAFKNELRDRDLSLGSSSFKGVNCLIPILRKDATVLTVLSTSIEAMSFMLKEQNLNSLDELMAAVLLYLEKNDLRTDAEIMDDLVLNEMNNLMKDPAFTAHLKNLGYSIEADHREDNDYLYYDLTDEKGQLAGSYALQKEFGELYLMDRDDIPVRSLKTFAPDHELSYSFQENSVESSEPSIYMPSSGSETFLLIGCHEHNADTMIIVHCNSITEEIVMLSVPRDLYYKGLKINSIYRNYGPARLASELSTITGLDISRYVAIDMYAFIDVVNLLGGIDVELDEALIDPTYKVRENGQWSTLYYPRGEHHLDGIAALRIARSRHTSSDFERAVRQQKVIAALRDNVSDMGISDITKMYDFMQVAQKYLGTNLSTSDLVRYFLSYKDYKINGQNVLNTDNVLYATYTNLYRLSDEEQEKALEDPGFYKGGWIVLPKNNDWSRIKLFIRSILTSS
ncbi:MAG: hypothetical protein B6241_08930 [Spirochaetaceae bacterium 4572_59]|nr:MAG: hypothetical protein B6241_08930 [Spirochaetaceae bacterium 4572_59]